MSNAAAANPRANVGMLAAHDFATAAAVFRLSDFREHGYLPATHCARRRLVLPPRVARSTRSFGARLRAGLSLSLPKCVSHRPTIPTPRPTDYRTSGIQLYVCAPAHSSPTSFDRFSDRIERARQRRLKTSRPDPRPRDAISPAASQAPGKDGVDGQ
jgi:hypothetical protein